MSPPGPCHLHPAGCRDDPNKVKAAVLDYKEIVAEVDRLKKQYSFKEDDKAQICSDQATIDAGEEWVPRNKWMNRLTGAAPWNVEAPPAKLQEHGFLTPNTVHYVRNHGIVPQLSFFDHSIQITGLVDRPLTISMAELVQMPTITMPVTLNCAGNRRKEQNLIQKGIGFDWGPSAASTAIWTGVPLHVIFEKAGIQDAAKWLNFAGPVGEVPREDKTYGASHHRDVMLNPQRCAMLAFLMNGEPLHPDHGYPVRLLIPGYIGGRMIKWLSTITVTKEEGENWYHVYDNRVFPKHVVNRDVATEEKIWTDPSYVINDRNTQSIMWSPAHCQKVPLKQKSLRLAGYAYCGSGKQPSRVEVTLNRGEHWRVAEIAQKEPERTNDFGLRYCWVLWELEVAVEDLAKTPEIAVRCWDGQNTQPDWPTWNLMGMMNNPWFRVRIHVEPGKDMWSDGFLWCEHPTRVESSGVTWNDNVNSLTIAYKKEDLHVLENGHLASKGWMEENVAQVKEWYAPKEKERSGEEVMQATAVASTQRKASKETPEALPAVRRSIPTECFAGCSVTMLDRDPAVAWRKIGFFGFLGLGAISACGPPALAMGFTASVLAGGVLAKLSDGQVFN